MKKKRENWWEGLICLMIIHAIQQFHGGWKGIVEDFLFVVVPSPHSFHGLFKFFFNIIIKISLLAISYGF